MDDEMITSNVSLSENFGTEDSLPFHQPPSFPPSTQSSSRLSGNTNWTELTAGTVTAFLLFLIVYLFASPFIRPHDITDTSLWMDQANNTVPYAGVVVFMITLPLSYFYLYIFHFGPFSKKSFNEKQKILFYLYLKYLFGVCLVLLVTEVLKVSVGRQRPDYFARCKPDPSDKKICTGNPSDIAEGRKSFPSGHSSSAFYLMSYLALFYVWHRSTYRIPPHALLLMTLSYLAAALVAVTRLQNNRHHPTDVLAGSFLGIFFSFIVVKYI